jgi:glucose/arabinose dehydrogenase
VRIVDGLQQPVHLTAPAGDARLFIVEQPGRIQIVRDGRLLREPFLDLTDRIRSGGERGLLSVAFHPRYRSNGLFYVNYTDRAGDTRIERYRVRSDPDRADPASATLVLEIDQPYANHNGGHIVFGPDGKLWIGMGDGGSGGDPQRHGQNRASLLGKMLRIDVDARAPYAIPADNPFARTSGTRPEIWALGMRNPWRFCFDRRESLLVIADVGQNQWEEIDAVSLRSAGANFGWNVMEGNHCYDAPNCRTTGFIPPVLQYSHGEGCSITGGVVYRGRAIPMLGGHYLFTDYCRGWIRSARLSPRGATDYREWAGLHVDSPTSFGEDASGEVYVLSHSGAVYRIAAAR